MKWEAVNGIPADWFVVQGSRLVPAAFTAHSSPFLSSSVLLHIIGNTSCVSNLINSSPQIIPDPSGKLKYFDKLN